MTSADDLKDQIKKAFANVEYPGDDNLIDNVYDDESVALVREFIGKTDWRLLDPKFLDQAPEGWGTAMICFSDEAFKFYLPAYLIADIEGKLHTSDPSSRLCISLTPQVENQKIAKIWGGGTMGSHARSEFDNYEGNQVLAIVAYLWWRLETEGSDLTIEQALENYWMDRASQLKGTK